MWYIQLTVEHRSLLSLSPQPLLSSSTSPLLRFHQNPTLILNRQLPQRLIYNRQPLHQPSLLLPLPLPLPPHLPTLLQPCPLLPRQLPPLRKLHLGLELVMAEIQRHVLEHVRLVLRLLHQRVDQVAQVPLVLRRRLEHLGAHFHNVSFGVVAGSDEFDEFDALGLREGAQVPRAEFEDNFLGAWVRFAHVGRVAEAEGLVEGRRREGFG